MKKILNEDDIYNRKRGDEYKAIAGEQLSGKIDNTDISSRYILPNGINDDELYNRVKTFTSEYITKNTLDELSNMYISIFKEKNLKKDKYSKGEKVFKNVFEKLKLLFNDNMKIKNNNFDKNKKIKNCLEIFADKGYDSVENYIKGINDDIDNSMSPSDRDTKTNESVNTFELDLLLEGNIISKTIKKIKNKFIDTPTDNNGKNILKARLIILGYTGDNFDWGMIKLWMKNNCPKNSDTWKNKLNNENNLLKYLSDEGWKKLENTLDLPIEGQDDDEKEKSASKIAKHIVKVVSNYLFKTPIPKSIENLIDTIDKKIKWKIWGFQFIKSKFGKKILGFMVDELKEDYVDVVANTGKSISGVKFLKIIKKIESKLFWKNAIVYNCFSEKAFDRINTAVRNVTTERDDIWKSSMKQIMTSLETRTYLYRIEYKDDNKRLSDNNENIKDVLEKIGKFNINGRAIIGKKIDANTLKKYDKKILIEMPKIYYIIVSEGLIKKGKLLNKVKDKLMPKTSGDSMEKMKKYMGL